MGELCDFKKVRVNGGTNNHSYGFPQVSLLPLTDPHDGNQIISSTRPSCYIHLSTVGVINIAADHQMFMTLAGELS